MKTEVTQEAKDEIKKVQDDIKEGLTVANEPQQIAYLQGQYAALRWVVTLDEIQEEVEKE